MEEEGDSVVGKFQSRQREMLCDYAIYIMEKIMPQVNAFIGVGRIFKQSFCDS